MAGRFYDKRSWRRLRLAHLAMEPLCRTCKRRGLVVAGRQVDHIKPIEDGGNEYDHANLQSLCDECHGRKTVIDEGGRPRVAFGTDGMPIDAHHHWNKT